MSFGPSDPNFAFTPEGLDQAMREFDRIDAMYQPSPDAPGGQAGTGHQAAQPGPGSYASAPGSDPNAGHQAGQPGGGGESEWEARVRAAEEARRAAEAEAIAARNREQQLQGVFGQLAQVATQQDEEQFRRQVTQLMDENPMQALALTEQRYRLREQGLNQRAAQLQQALEHMVNQTVVGGFTQELFGQFKRLGQEEQQLISQIPDPNLRASFAATFDKMYERMEQAGRTDQANLIDRAGVSRYIGSTPAAPSQPSQQGVQGMSPEQLLTMIQQAVGATPGGMAGNPYLGIDPLDILAREPYVQG